jgi:RecJ-like exonuclease
MSESSEFTDCPRCDGTGRYQRGPTDEEKSCSICNGTGKIGSDGLGAKMTDGGIYKGPCGEPLHGSGRPMGYADLADYDEDTRIKVIGHTAMRTKKIIGIIVEDDEKADRYISKLTALYPAIKVVERGPGPIENTIAIKIKAEE